ncbi:MULTISPECIES: cyclic pyranopterin monophosphate synthase MoaC [unclassified Pseudoalteromonas]|uniref:cyclic pyranopterin monophosphate synthase MoaC n=1 Tax=unclassified Pseudoalteromonas TaxID=194690 RepID=UPI00140E4FC5|nr:MULTISPECIES: cyclic pyranopterin monophosphate synthase MoaC [unclassified Pseudoalteromonas]NHH88811.1 Cyclic pyranopterin monophosphate synthase [Pseudoalteromonas sp. MB47]
MQLTHIDETGQAAMVDVANKAVTIREAKAQAIVKMQANTLALICQNQLKKGDVLAVARIAGIQAAKKTADLIPLCHPLALSKVAVEFTIDELNSTVQINSYCKLAGQTGVEMEALTAVSVAALTMIDMCKAVDQAMTVDALCVTYKTGGQRGTYQRSNEELVNE